MVMLSTCDECTLPIALVRLATLVVNGSPLCRTMELRHLGDLDLCLGDLDLELDTDLEESEEYEESLL